MSMNTKTSNIESKRFAAIMLTAAGLLCIPLIAMQFEGSGVQWTAIDFAVAGVLLFGTGLACELVMRKVKTSGYRFFFIGLLLLALFLVWAELAVGIFGTALAGS